MTYKDEVRNALNILVQTDNVPMEHVACDSRTS